MNIMLYSLFQEGFNAEFREKIQTCAPGAVLHYYNGNTWSDEEYHRLLRETDITVGIVPSDALRYLENVKLMQFDIAGVDSFLDNPDTPKGAILCNAGGAYGRIIAEHAVALTMALCRDLPVYCENRLAQRWQVVKPDKPVEGSTVLILGAGDIGCSAARMLRPIVGENGRFIGVRRVAREKPDCFDEIRGFDALNDALPAADIVLCALPSTPLTEGLLNIERLRLMKDDAVLVNVGRGSLIPLDDLCTVLNEGKFKGVGIDVAQIEPLPKEHPIWSCPRLLITPHSAGGAVRQDSPTTKRIYEIIYKNIARFCAGQSVDHVIDRSTGYRITNEKEQ